MKDLTQSFNRLLEQYLTTVATKFFESASHKNQAGLINLILGVDTVSAVIDNKQSLRSIQPVDTEWQQVLNKPVDLRSVHNQWLVGITRHRIRQQEAYIAHIELAIEFTQQQYQIIQTNFLNEPSRSKLLCRNNTILKQYERHLAIARTNQKAATKQLSRLNGICH